MGKYFCYRDFIHSLAPGDNAVRCSGSPLSGQSCVETVCITDTTPLTILVGNDVYTKRSGILQSSPIIHRLWPDENTWKQAAFRVMSAQKKIDALYPAIIIPIIASHEDVRTLLQAAENIWGDS